MKNLSDSKSKIIYVLGLILATLFWGLAFIAQLDGSENIGTCWFNGFRFTIGGIVLIIPAFFLERKQYNKQVVKKTLGYGIITGLMLFGAVFFQQLGVLYTKSPGISAFITDTYTLLVPLALFLVFRKKVNVRTWIGVILATVGLYVLCVIGVKDPFYQQTTTIFLGEALLFVCALFFTVHIIFVDRLGGGIPTLLYCIVQFITIGIVSLSIAIFTEPISFTIIKAATVPILYCGLLSVGVSYTLQMVCQKKIDPVLCVLIFPLESVFSSFFSIVFGSDKLTVWFVLGSILILLGITVPELDLRSLFGKKKKE